MSGTAHDLFDRDPVLGQAEDGGVIFLSAEITFVLDPFGSGEQLGVDRGRADYRADLTW